MNSSNEEKKSKVDFLYKIGRAVLVLFLKLFYGLRIEGRENIPEGAAVFCANHSNSLDPVYIAAAVDAKQQVHFMAKKEIFAKKFFSKIFYAVGAFPVNRGGADISAIKTALRYLKSGEKIGIFPEGTRTSRDDAVQAKNGALKIAERSGASIVPVYIPRDKRIFRKNTVVVGVPYKVNTERKKLSAEEYTKLADELMKKISGLKPEN